MTPASRPLHSHVVCAMLRPFGLTLLTRIQYEPPPERVIGYGIGPLIRRFTCTAGELAEIAGNLPPDRQIAYRVDVGRGVVTFPREAFDRAEWAARGKPKP